MSRRFLVLYGLLLAVLLLAPPAKSDSRAAAAPAGETTSIYMPLINSRQITFRDEFLGAPPVPTPWSSPDWSITVHSRNRETWEVLDPVDAHHGPNCEPPLATHVVTAYEDTVYQCANHIMTAINASGYAMIYRTPDHMVDFSSREAVIRFDMSTLRSSGRDWVDLWITPLGDNLVNPLQDSLPDGNGPPRNALHITMKIVNDSISGGAFKAVVYRNFNGTDLPVETNDSYETVLVPDARQRVTFELRLRHNYVKFGLPDYDLWWVDTPMPSLNWRAGIVQFGHHSYHPGKACNFDGSCGPGTWHWGPVEIFPARPFTIQAIDRRVVSPDAGTVVQLSQQPLPGSYLRFSGIGENIQVSFNNGASWQSAAVQAQQSRSSGRFRTYWQPLPEGTTSVRFRGTDWYGGDWHLRDLEVWSPTVQGRGD